MGVSVTVIENLVDAIVAAAPRLREAGVSRLSVDDVSFDLAATPPGKPLTTAEQDALEARLHKLEQERAGREETERRRIQTAAAGGFQPRGVR